MKVAFTTLVCPDWDLDTIIAQAAEIGFDGIDFRGTKKGLDVTLQEEFGKGAERTKQLISDAGLVTSGISSSISLCDESKLEENVEEARRTISVARALGAKQVRVFGNGDETLGRAQRVDVAKRCFEAIRSIDGADEVNWLLEMHDIWISTEDCLALIDGVGSPGLGILWDIGHTTRIGDESAEVTYSALKDRIAAVHLKDAVYEPEHAFAMKDGWRYVLPGRGQLPIADAVQLLKGDGFAGWYVFEHEKRWHEDLEEPELALRRFKEWIDKHSA